jgi:hypothetical protein
MSSRLLTHALPSCKSEPIAAKPLSHLYPQELTTLGDHLHEERLDLKLLQKDIAKMLGTEADCVTYWEINRLEPLLPLILRMPAFLG